MPTIFINYRTGDGDQIAATLDEALCRRFGPDTVFRDGRLLRAGTEFPHELLTALRKSSALLVVIGATWVAEPRLRHADDWVRREIIEARESRIPIYPVLGDGAPRWLPKDRLPAELSWLADIQALPYAAYTSATDLVRIGDELIRTVPELTDTQRQQTPPGQADGTHNTVNGGGQGTLVQGRDFSGDIAGTMYKGVNSTFNTGPGDQHLHHHTNSPHFSGDGGTFVAGDNHEGVRHSFDRRRPTRPDEDDRR